MDTFSGILSHFEATWYVVRKRLRTPVVRFKRLFPKNLIPLHLSSDVSIAMLNIYFIHFFTHISLDTAVNIISSL